MNAASSCLTRHFVRHFLDIGFMSPEGADGVRRAALGVLSAVLAIGLLLARMMMTRYSAIAATATVYRASVLGDTLMTFGFAMLAAAFAAALAGESMFPDETDFRVLTPLPVTRGFVFAAKLRAVGLYLGVVIVVVSLALQLPFTLVSIGPHAEGTWVVRAAAHAAASIAGAFFAALAVMAIQGLIVLGAPGRYLRPITVAARTAMLCGVIMLLPLAGRLPGHLHATPTRPRSHSDSTPIRFQ